MDEAAWDDRGLVSAWDKAMRAYKLAHGDRDWKTHAQAENQGEEEKSEKESIEKVKHEEEQVEQGGSRKRRRDELELEQPVPGSDLAHGETGEAAEANDDTARSEKRARLTVDDTAITSASHSALAPSLPEAATHDPTLAQLLHSWYWAGYCAARYDEAHQTHSANADETL